MTSLFHFIGIVAPELANSPEISDGDARKRRRKILGASRQLKRLHYRVDRLLTPDYSHFLEVARILRRKNIVPNKPTVISGLETWSPEALHSYIAEIQPAGGRVGVVLSALAAKALVLHYCGPVLTVTLDPLTVIDFEWDEFPVKLRAVIPYTHS